MFKEANNKNEYYATVCQFNFIGNVNTFSSITKSTTMHRYQG